MKPAGYGKRGVAIGLLAGGLSGMFGVGAGILIVPALAILAKMPQRLAHGTSLGATGPLALAGVIGYAVEGSVDWRVAAVLIVGSAAGAVVGTHGLHVLPETTLRLLFAGLLAVTGLRMIIAVADPAGRPGLTFGTAAGLLALGAFSGTVAGLMGVGGGIIMVPAQMLLFSIPSALAKGTSLAVIVPTAIVGTTRNVRNGNVDLRAAAAISLAGVLAAYAGSKAALRMDPVLSSVLFGGLLLVAALRLLFQQPRAAIVDGVAGAVRRTLERSRGATNESTGGGTGEEATPPVHRSDTPKRGRRRGWR